MGRDTDSKDLIDMLEGIVRNPDSTDQMKEDARFTFYIALWNKMDHIGTNSKRIEKLETFKKVIVWVFSPIVLIFLGAIGTGLASGIFKITP